jgi:hypothetical protein
MKRSLVFCSQEGQKIDCPLRASIPLHSSAKTMHFRGIEMTQPATVELITICCADKDRPCGVPGAQVPVEIEIVTEAALSSSGPTDFYFSGQVDHG